MSPFFSRGLPLQTASFVYILFSFTQYSQYHTLNCHTEKRKKKPTSTILWALRVKLWNRFWVSIWSLGNRRLAGSLSTMHNIWNVTSHNIGRTVHTPCTKVHWKLVHTFHCSVQSVKSDKGRSPLTYHWAQHCTTSKDQCILLYSKVYLYAVYEKCTYM